jgi:flavin reductase (DIM6/NTAB) family NADH-FMN oxidoreductase RutF
MKKSLGAKTIIYPTPVLVIGSYDMSGRPNVMTAAWGGICCSSPPCLTVSLRKATYTYASICERKAFTVNVPSEKHLEAVDYFGIASGRNEDKFSRSGLTSVKSDLVDAPYVREFPFILECRLIHTYEIGLHTQFIGEILDIKADEDMLDDKGFLSVEKIKPICYTPEYGHYFGLGRELGKAHSMGKRISKE